MMQALINHLWQSTLFAVAAGSLTLFFRRNRANVRFWLWFAASVKFFVPFGLLIGLGSQLAVAPAVHRITMVTPEVSATVQQVVQPFEDTVTYAPVSARVVAWRGPAMAGVWIAGLLGIAMLRLRGWRRVRRAVLHSWPMEIEAAVEVRASAGMLEPGVVGWLRPVLLLPENITGQLSGRQLEAVLTHELCHVGRRDNLLASVHMVTEAIFWFHPLVWWIGARLVEERERACDEEVLQQGNEPRVYAEAIVNVCKLYAESPLVCVAGVTGSDLKKRIEGIMKNRNILRLNFAKKTALAMAGVAAVAAPLLVGMLHPVVHGTHRFVGNLHAGRERASIEP